MPVNYTSSFNAGELSRKIDGRTDLEIYKSGCRDLDNFLVLPQGGVERRAGTQFVALAGTNGSSPARMIPFDFSSTTSYVVELGAGYARVHYTEDGVDKTVEVSGFIPYGESELRKLQFTRSYDTLTLTSPNFPVQSLKRTTVAPSFEMSQNTFVYPPLRDRNITSTTIESTGGKKDEDVTLTSNKPIFVNISSSNTHKGSIWAFDSIRSAAQKSIGFKQVNEPGIHYSDPLEVSFCNWSLTTNDNWNGAFVIERSVGGGVGESDFIEYVAIADTTTGEQRNFAYSSQVPEDANTFLRIKYLQSSTAGTCKANIKVEEYYHRGLVEITGVSGAGVPITGATHAADELTITAVAHDLEVGDFVLLSSPPLAGEDVIPSGEFKITDLTVNTFSVAYTGGSTINTANAVIEASSRSSATVKSLLNATAVENTVISETVHWSEAAYSYHRGFSPSSEYFQNRLWFSGSASDPSVIYGSAFNDTTNFLSGKLSTDSIKRTVDSPEEPKWLKGKKVLFLGTAGTAVSIKSVDRDALITPSNINTQVENSYGSAPIQAELANDVVVYVQRDGLKLRELVYAQDQDVYVGNDLNLLSEDITDSGIVEMFVQKQPNQFVWCIKGDGTAAILTYERGNSVQGWARIETDGAIFSGAPISGEGEDVVWLCVNRGTEAAPKFYIEKFHPRADLGWRVDCGLEFGVSDKKQATVEFFNLVRDDDTANQDADVNFDTLVRITSENHDLSNGDIIKFCDQTNWSFLTRVPFKVEVINEDEFYIESVTGTYIVPIFEDDFPENVTGTFSSTYNSIDLPHLDGRTVQITLDGSFIGNFDVEDDKIDLGEDVTGTVIAGLKYVSTLRPMPIEPAARNSISQSRVKASSKVTVRFLNTKGAKVGEAGKQLTNFPVVQTTDLAGKEVALTTGEKRFFIGSDWESEKLIEVRQDLPYPMTVLSIASWVTVEGG